MVDHFSIQVEPFCGRFEPAGEIPSAARGSRFPISAITAISAIA